MDISNKKILITGSGGFIGANLVRAVIGLGVSPHLLLRQKSDIWRIKDVLNQTTIHIGDIRDDKGVLEIVKKLKPHIIFHNAVYGGFTFQKDHKDIVETNFVGTINLLNACNTVDYEMFVNTGSSSEYGVKNCPMREEDLPEPLTNYGVAKVAATLYCQAVAKSENRPIVTLRLFSPYGYYEEKNRLIPSLILSCLRRQSPKLSSPYPVRDFIFIEDVVRAYLNSIDHAGQLGGKVINIAGGKQYSVAQIAETVITMTEAGVEPEWGACENPRKEPAVWNAEIAKAKELIGWVPETDITQGIGKTIEWFKKHKDIYENR